MRDAVKASGIRGPFDLHLGAVNLLETTQNEVACIQRNASLEWHMK
jgi:hypothetical protein